MVVFKGEVTRMGLELERVASLDDRLGKNFLALGRAQRDSKVSLECLRCNFFGHYYQEVAAWSKLC